MHLEAHGGMVVDDGSRRHTPGGVFLKLTKQHLNQTGQQRLLRTLFPSWRDWCDAGSVEHWRLGAAWRAAAHGENAAIRAFFLSLFDLVDFAQFKPFCF
jgi:hypothetical protein